MRCFLKGDYGMAQAAINRITGSLDLYGKENRGENATVNFLNCHDGFTLYDMYAYQCKHNEKNGWNNTDGADDNNSWNCGAEGDTDSGTAKPSPQKCLCRADVQPWFCDVPRGR